MAKLDNYTKDAATRARKSQILIAAVLNRAEGLDPTLVKYLERAMCYSKDVVDILTRNDEQTKDSIMDLNCLNDIYTNVGPDSQANELRALKHKVTWD